jgi:lambda family phage portal protein
VSLILGPDGKPFSQHGRHVRRVRASFDAAQTNTENENHWANADALSADRAASKAVRTTLRKRGRYEVANNSYARGIVNFLASDCIGTKVRLQFTATDQNTNKRVGRQDVLLSREDASFIEGEFFAWAQECHLFDLLRTLRAARCIDGESFGVLTFNPRLSAPVKLAVRDLEADYVTAGDPFRANSSTYLDGIRYDRYGNPTYYEVLKNHPGDYYTYNDDFEAIRSDLVFHLYLRERPGQRRGISELTPALPLFAMLRRWTLASVAAAETAADLAAILFVRDGMAAEAADSETPFDTIPIEPRVMMTLPEGWDMKQFDPKQPISTYKEVKRELLGEICRCTGLPVHLALNDSSEHNYASARMDTQGYIKTRRVDRDRVEAQALDVIWNAWLAEAVLIDGYLPQRVRSRFTDWSHTWMFDGDEHVDPLKEAGALKIRLDSFAETLSQYWAGRGKDWEEMLEQIGRERAKMEELGLTTNDIALSMTENDQTGEATWSYNLDRDPAGRLRSIKAASKDA